MLRVTTQLRRPFESTVQALTRKFVLADDVDLDAIAQAAPVQLTGV